MKAALRGPEEMLGEVHVEYVFERNDPVLTAIARGEPFRVVLPKQTFPVLFTSFSLSCYSA